VWRADFRGHGTSGPQPAEGGRWTYDELVRLDLPALVAAAREAGGPVGVAGHSLGGHVTAAACAEGLELDALVLLAANIWMPSLEPSRRRRLAKAASLAPLDVLARGLPYVPMQQLGVWPSDEASGYLRDLCRFWWQDRWGPRDGGDWLAGLPDASTGPILAVVGAADRLLARPEAARLWVDHFERPVDVWLAGTGRLGLRADLDHMGVGSAPEAGPLWERIAGWLTAALPPAPE
jgi:predicted alpha/beta hydrolase